MLEDPKGAFPSYDALVLIAPETAKDAKLVAALKPLVGRIDVAAMREANYAVDRSESKLTPREAAEALAKRIGL